MLLPPPPTAETWPALHAEPLARWAPALDALRATWRLPDDAWSRLPGGEDSAVFASGPDVVKLVPPFLAADPAREVAVLRRLALSVPTPRVLDVAELEGWTAVRMSRLDGVRATDVWSSLPRADQRRLLTRIGALLRELWATPLEPSDGDPLALFERLRVRADRHASAGFDATTAYLARIDGSLPAPALLHLDLHDGNFLVAERGSRWELSGVLDLVASRAFYPPLDLVTPGVFLARGDGAAVRALLDGAGLDLDPEDLAAWHVLHPFSDLPRDLAMAGLSGFEHLEALWRAA